MGPSSGDLTVAVSSVLVVDDHRVFAELLAERLRRETAVEHAQVACTVEQARSAVAQRAPDVILLDPDLEGGSGLDLIPHLDDLGTRPRVVVLAERTGVPEHELLDGCDWVSKESPFEDLLRTIDAVRRGEVLRPRAPEPAGRTSDGSGVVVQMRAGPGPTGVAAALHPLTERQAAVLECLLAGMTRAEVATRLRLSTHTVRDHVRHLFRILDVTSTPELIASAQADAVAEPGRLRLVPGP
jgi:DNA-binding NarL/FixJ family response regulator